MLLQDLRDCEQFVAGDNTILRELLHPDKVRMELRYSLAHAIVKPGDTSLPHRLKASEVYYILQGTGLMWIGDESAEVRPGQAVYIPPHSVQRVKNIGDTDLEFLCIVDPAWRQENEEVLH